MTDLDDRQESEAVADIMNVSIDWPVGRDLRPQPNNDSIDSVCDISTFDVTVCAEIDSPVTPIDLAESRKREWPNIMYGAIHHPLLDIYRRVRDTGLPNRPSMLNYPTWRSVATGHPDDDYILDGIRFGFPLHYVGPALWRENRDSSISTTALDPRPEICTGGDTKQGHAGPI